MFICHVLNPFFMAKVKSFSGALACHLAVGMSK
jgi:hypothetical protein